MIRKALTRAQVIDAVERRGGPVPVLFHKWWGGGLEEKYGAALTEMADQFPDDVCVCPYLEPGQAVSTNGNPEYRMGHRGDYSQAERHSIGQDIVLLPDWDELDAFLAHYPDPNEPGNFDCVKLEAAKADGRYLLGMWWRLFHERFWTIRGMENLMMDYYDNMDGLKRIGRKVLSFYKVILEKYAALGFDGIFTSDDLGHQTGPMMSPDIFQELYLPLYKEFIAHAHSLGLHVFLHSCGDNSLLLP